MQNRYVGDVGTFGQLGLLRWLTGMTGPKVAPEDRLRLGVVWYMHHDFDNAGGRVGYLGNPQQYRECDSNLFDFLGGLVRYGNRNIWAVQQSGILPFDTNYYERCLTYDPEMPAPRREAIRQNWVDGALYAVAEAELIFVDPDNGIRERGHYRNDGPKYVYVDDLQTFARQNHGKSLVIYHHLPRVEPPAGYLDLIRGRSQRLEEELEPCQISALVYRAGGAAYLIAAQPGHQVIIEGCLAGFMASPWGNLFERVV